MKKILLLFSVFVFLLSCHSNSQQGRGPGERINPEEMADRMVERMDEELGLTKQQQKELKTWFVDSFKKRSENVRKNKKSREEMRAEIKKNREENEAQLKKILTEEQFKQYRENEAMRQQERREHSDRRRPREEGRQL